MTGLYEYELGRAADVLVGELLKLKPGEDFVITGDTESDTRVIEATARAAFAAGARPMVVMTASPLGVGRQTDRYLPVEPLRAALKNTDVWVEFNGQYLNYSETWRVATSENSRLRYLCLTAMNVDVFVRLFARVDSRRLRGFLERVAAVISEARRVRITTPAGEDISFENDPSHPVLARTGYTDKPGTSQLAGMIAWAPAFDTIEGVIVSDGSIVPQIGLLSQPVRLHLSKGTIQRIEGGREAAEWEAWLRSFDDPQMLRAAHVSCGFHPCAKLTGQIGEDERIWGATQWGFGAVGPSLAPPHGVPAPSHTDAISLSSSVWLDGRRITDRGKVVDPELAALAEGLI